MTAPTETDGLSPAGAGETALLARDLALDVLSRLADGRNPCLEGIAGPALGLSLPLPPPGRLLLLGRGETCDLVVSDPGLSREHVRLRCAFTGVEVSDLGSRNGTWLRSGRLVPGARRRIVHGDTLAAGTSAWRLWDPAEEVLAALEVRGAIPAPPKTAGRSTPARREWLRAALAAAIALVAAAALVGLFLYA